MLRLMISVIFVLLGVFMLRHPDMLFQISESWKSYSLEDKPSHMYVWMMRIVGIIFIILGFLHGILVFLGWIR